MKSRIKKYALILILCLSYSLSLMAQHDKGRHEQIESIKVAFITNKLSLTSEEAQKFWPIYNDYQREWMSLMQKRKAGRTKENMNAASKIDADLEYESRMLDLKKKYKTIYERAIPPQKILLLYQAEREFREHLIKQLNHRRRSDS